MAKVLHDQVIFLGQQLEQELEANRETQASSLAGLVQRDYKRLLVCVKAGQTLMPPWDEFPRPEGLAGGGV